MGKIMVLFYFHGSYELPTKKTYSSLASARRAATRARAKGFCAVVGG